MLSRTLRTKLEVERKFVPTTSFLALADAAKHSSYIQLTSSAGSTTTFSRQPKKILTDRYYDKNGQLEKQGIWVRLRRVETVARDGKTIVEEAGKWETKIREGGDYIASTFEEREGGKAVNEVLKERGIDIHYEDLKYNVGFRASRVGWKLHSSSDKPINGAEDAPIMKLTLDTMLAGLEGPNGMLPKYFNHTVGELELTKNITTHDSDPATHQAEKDTAVEEMRLSIDDFMKAHPQVLDVYGKPVGKLSAYIRYLEDRRERLWKAHEPNRIANIAENKWEALPVAERERMTKVVQGLHKTL